MASSADILLNIITRGNQQANDDIKGIGLAVGAMGAAFVAVGKIVSDVASKFEVSMRNIASLTNMTEKEFNKLSESVKDLSKMDGISDSATSLANGMYDLVSSGFDAADSLKIVAVASKAAGAGLTNTETSVKALAAVMNSYNNKSLKASIEYSDDLFQIVKGGVVTFDQLANNLGSVLPVAKATNVSFKEVGASYIELTKAGINASESQTAIAGLLRMIAGAGPEAKKAAEDMGLSLRDSFSEAALATKGLSGVLADLDKATGGSLELMKKLVPDATAANAALVLSANGATKFKTSLEDMNKSGGAAASALNEQSKSFEFQTKKLGNELDELKITFGGLVQQAIIPFISQIRDGIKFVSSLDKETKESIVGWGLFAVKVTAAAGAIAGIAVAAGPVISAYGLLSAGVVAIIPWFTSLAAVIGVGGALLTGFAAVAAAAVVLAGTLYAIKKGYDWVVSAAKQKVENVALKKTKDDAYELTKAYQGLSEAEKKALSVDKLNTYSDAFKALYKVTDNPDGKKYLGRIAIQLQKEAELKQKHNDEQAEKDKAAGIAKSNAAVKAYEANEKNSDKEIAKREAAERKIREASKNTLDTKTRDLENYIKAIENKEDISQADKVKKLATALKKEAALYTEYGSKGKHKEFDSSDKAGFNEKATDLNNKALKIEKDYLKQVREERYQNSLTLAKGEESAAIQRKELLLKQGRDTLVYEKQLEEEILNDKTVLAEDKIAMLKQSLDIELMFESENSEKVLKLKKQILDLEIVDREEKYQKIREYANAELRMEQIAHDEQVNRGKMHMQTLQNDLDLENSLTGESVQMKLFMKEQELADEERIFGKGTADYKRLLMERNELLKQSNDKTLNLINDLGNILQSSSNNILQGIGGLMSGVTDNLNKGISVAKSAASGDFLPLIQSIGTELVKSFDFMSSAWEGFNKAVRKGTEGTQDFLQAQNDLIRSIPFMGGMLADLQKTLLELFGVKKTDKQIKQEKEFEDSINHLQEVILKSGVQTTEKKLALIDQEHKASLKALRNKGLDDITFLNESVSLMIETEEKKKNVLRDETEKRKKIEYDYNKSVLDGKEDSFQKSLDLIDFETNHLIDELNTRMVAEGLTQDAMNKAYDAITSTRNKNRNKLEKENSNELSKLRVDAITDEREKRYAQYAEEVRLENESAHSVEVKTQKIKNLTADYHKWASETLKKENEKNINLEYEYDKAVLENRENSLDKTIALIELERNKELDLLDEQLKSGLIKWAEFDKKKGQLEFKYQAQIQKAKQDAQKKELEDIGEVQGAKKKKLEEEVKSVKDAVKATLSEIDKLYADRNQDKSDKSGLNARFNSEVNALKGTKSDDFYDTNITEFDLNTKRKTSRTNEALNDGGIGLLERNKQLTEIAKEGYLYYKNQEELLTDPAAKEDAHDKAIAFKNDYYDHIEDKEAIALNKKLAVQQKELADKMSALKAAEIEELAAIDRLNSKYQNMALTFTNSLQSGIDNLNVSKIENAVSASKGETKAYTASEETKKALDISNPTSEMQAKQALDALKGISTPSTKSLGTSMGNFVSTPPKYYPTSAEQAKTALDALKALPSGGNTSAIDRVKLKGLIQSFQGDTAKADNVGQSSRALSDNELVKYAHGLGIPGYAEGSPWISSPQIALIGEGRVREKVVREDQYGGGGNFTFAPVISGVGLSESQVMNIMNASIDNFANKIKRFIKP